MLTLTGRLMFQVEKKIFRYNNENYAIFKEFLECYILGSIFHARKLVLRYMFHDFKTNTKTCQLFKNLTGNGNIFINLKF